MSFGELSPPTVKDQAQESESHSLAPLNTTEEERATQTILVMPSYGQAGATVVDLSTPDTSPPLGVCFEPEVQTIEVPNVEPTWINFAAQDVHTGINTVAVFEDKVNPLPQQVLLL